MTERNRHLIKGGLLAITIVFLLIGAAAATPAIAHQFYGTVSNNLGPAPAGSMIVAKINDNIRGTFTTNATGIFGGPDNWDDKLVVTADSSEVGQTIVFWVNGYQASPTAMYQEGGKTEIALTYTVPVPTTTTTTTTPTPTPTPTVTPTPTPTPTPTINRIPQGGDVFIGEEGLDIRTAMGSFTQVAWFRPGTDPLIGQPDQYRTIPTSIQAGYFIDPLSYSGYTGNWYRWDGGATRGQVAFNVVDPSIVIYVWNQYTQKDVSGSSIPVGQYANFRIETNLHTITQRPGYSGQGFMNIKVQSPDGGIFTALMQSSSQSLELTDLAVNDQVWYWVQQNIFNKGWNTGYKDQYGARVYQDGTYRVWAESNVNGIKDNYKDASGGDYTGKTVSYTKTVKVESKPLTLSVNTGSIVRGNAFSAIINGDPNSDYVLWIRSGCEKMSGLPCDQPPTIAYNQEGVSRDSSLGATCFDCSGCIKHISDVVAPIQYPVDYYVRVRTDWNGTRTVDFLTNLDTAPGVTYTVATLPITPDLFTVPHTPVETQVTVNMGQVSFNLYANGNPVTQTYLGEKIWIRGTNTDPSGYVYLLMTGPCQSCEGANLNGVTVKHGQPNTFTKVEVKSDNSWEYLWDTSNLKIDLGDYTIYATSKPDDASSLEQIMCYDCGTMNSSCAAWSKKPLKFLDPTVTADVNPKILKIVCCDQIPIKITGEATGLRNDACISCEVRCAEIAFWVFGENKVAGEKYLFDTVDVKCPSGSFTIDLRDYINTLKLEPGTYTIIVQHPMYNHRLDILPEDWIYPIYNEPYSYDDNRKFVVSSDPIRWSKLFVIDGPDRLVGSKASSALIQGFNNPNVDDKIVVLTFKVESNTAVLADFSGSPVTGIAPLLVQFTDLSTGNPTTWLWSFGDGSTSSLKNPTHTYSATGTYDVSLQVTNGASSSSITKRSYITVTQVSPTVTPTVVPANVINLNTGWNFVSTPRVLADGSNTIGTVFAGIDTGGRSIYLYDASTGNWNAMMATDLFKPLDGIWVYSTTPKQVNLVFRAGGATTPPIKNVYPGWNAIGFAGEESRSAQATLSTVNDEPRKKWAQVVGWNAVTQSYSTPIANVYPDSTALMYPTKGYWLFMNGENPPWILS
jgi:hypothetical protein